jgi:glycosyltransferase involved in cell wall biosynthesis
MLIEAAAPLLREGRLVLDIIGDGPEMARLKELARLEQVESGVKLDGWVEHAKLQDRLCSSDVFAFPSIREFGGGVVLEAMALGLAPLVVEYGGPAELITSDSGITVPIGTRRQIIDGFRRELTRLVEHPEDIRPMGERARRRVLRHFTWEAKALQVMEVYRWVLGERKTRPTEAELFPSPSSDVGTVEARQCLRSGS